MELSKFCPRCGEETDELYGEEKKLCAECYPDKNQLLSIPDVVEIDICSTCGRMRKSGEWIEEYTLEEQLGARFKEFAEEDVDMELQYWEEDDKMFVRVHAFKDEMKDEYDTELRIKKHQCETCSQFHGGFYKVKMQLRGDEDLERISNNMAEKAAEVTNEDRGSFLSNIEKNSHGFDFYLSTEKIAGEILSMLKAQHDPDVKRSYELITEEDGQKVYRNVISVRL
ncbi:MAG: nonsense-mediated mRNA decay protein 3 [Candidatus Nanohaloarchaea archaeon]|jgi:nonsense-mediated mRNA decay protein 3